VPGTTGILLAMVAAALVITGVWSHAQSPHFWKTTVVVSVFAIASAHCLALLAIRIPTSRSWLRWLTGTNIFLLAGVVAYMVVAEPHSDGMFRLVTVLAILAALETLIIPILSWVDKSGTPRTLVLTERGDGTYCDKDGRVYQVTEVRGPDSDSVPSPSGRGLG
jgi:hypothetical protein